MKHQLFIGKHDVDYRLLSLSLERVLKENKRKNTEIPLATFVVGVTKVNNNLGYNGNVDCGRWVKACTSVYVVHSPSAYTVRACVSDFR